MLYKKLLRPILFRVAGGDAEAIHDTTVAMLALASQVPGANWLGRILTMRQNPVYGRTLFGVHFPNPVGLAAGMDKNGVALAAWAAMGFGFVEAGTVTWQIQPGNPRPRIFRLPEHEALINRMGFNNDGAVALAARLRKLGRPSLPIGISLGKSRAAPLEKATDDYCASFRALYDFGSYFALNVSSPNTPGLRNLQDRAHLSELLAELQIINQRVSQARHAIPKPLLVKIAPDLSEAAISEVLDVAAEHGVSGIIATNTTIGRGGVADHPRASEAGGLSGRPLAARALEVVRFIRREAGPTLPIIGVGGIFTPDDALAMRAAGADLIQIYTGLIYQGPGVVRRIARAMV
ncbi:quinone-dependent dihydroorotate dehydrogenase [Candidatus Oscillochloris fontis]|uniref:quinone-dependent dihydroorotate dehydrogenase n=1 Tax=Candidatus Oscillochloris fontis TaxID=2496868 RepID=UPI00101C8254|nr:quinone-dependent dihydroorotate dehydrogenase [Candidatus Oscillochloris fontis]